MIFYIIIALILFIIIYSLYLYNKFVKLNNKVKEAFSTMDVYLKKRWDLIPNLVEVVKGYAKHEENTFEEVAKLRGSSYDDLSTKEKLNTNEELSKGISKIMVISEAYPELKANKNFLDLQEQLKRIEDEIAQSRKYYNATVREYNNKVEMIPSNFVAKIFNFHTKLMFEATDNERDNININL